MLYSLSCYVKRGMSFFRPPMESKNVKSLLKKKGFVYLGYFTLMVEVDYVAK